MRSHVSSNLTGRRVRMSIFGLSFQAGTRFVCLRTLAGGVLASVLLQQARAIAAPQNPEHTADTMEGTTIRDPGFIKAILSATSVFWQDRLNAKSNMTYKIQRNAYSPGPLEVLVDIEAGKVTSVLEFPSAKVLYSAGQTDAKLWGMPLPQAVMIPQISSFVIRTMEAYPAGFYSLRGELVWPLKLNITTDPDVTDDDDEVEYGITVYEPTVP